MFCRRLSIGRRVLPRVGIGVACLALVWGCGEDDNAGPTAVPTATPTPVSSDLAAAANGGGCYPTGVNPGLFDLLNLVNPEWAPVANGTTVDSEPVLIHGTAVYVHGDVGGDFPATHVRNDQNTFIRLDPEDRSRLASGNFGSDNEAVIDLEWEAGAYPAFAWADVGDRVVALGRWIFDCGHPGGASGHCSATTGAQCLIDSDCRPPTCAQCAPTETCADAHFGYSSELHPPQAVAVIRSGRGAVLSGSPVPVTKADVFVSPFGGGAGDRCILGHQTRPLDLLNRVECFPLSQPVAPINSTDFVFNVPLPAQPPGGHAVWNVIDAPAPAQLPGLLDVPATVTVSGPSGADQHLEVRVGMTQPDQSGHLPTGYAGTIVGGWDNAVGPFTHVQVTVRSVLIRNALQPLHPDVPRTCVPGGQHCLADTDCPGGQTCSGPVKSWRLQVAVNGDWAELYGLENVSSGDVIQENFVFDHYLPADGTLRIVANGDSDECIDTMLGQSLRTSLAQFGLDKGQSCLMTAARDPGTVEVSYPGPDFGAGSGAMEYETLSHGGVGGYCSATTTMACVVDGDCPSGESCAVTGGAFALRYRIERLP